MRRIFAAILGVVVVGWGIPAHAATPKYVPKPSSPAYQSSLPLSTSQRLSLPLIEGTGTPTEQSGGVAGVFTTQGAKTVAPVWNIDPTSGWANLTHTSTSQATVFAGRGITFPSDWGLAAAVRMTAAGDCQLVNFGVNTAFGIRCITGSGGSWGQLYAACQGNLVPLAVPGAANNGHRILIACTGAASSSTVTWWLVDLDGTNADMSGSGTSGAFATLSGTYSDLYINTTGDASGAMNGEHYGAWAWNRQITASDVAALKADLWAQNRAGTFTASPASVAQGAAVSVTLDGSAVSGEVASKFVTDGLSLTVGNPNSLANPPTISSVNVTSETAATFTLTAPANMATGSYELRDGTSKRKWSVLLTGTTFVGPATGYSLTGPSTGSVGVPSGSFTVTLTPTGGTSTGVTITPTDGISGSTLTASSVTLSTATPSATFTDTRTQPATGTVSTTNNGGLTNPSGISYTTTVPALSPGSLTQGTTTLETTAGISRTVQVTINGSAASGGYQNVYTWYKLATPGDAPGPSNVVVGQVGANLTLTHLPFGSTVYVSRKVTDAFGNSAFATWGAGSGSVAIIGAYAPLNVGVLILADSNPRNAATGSPPTLPNFNTYLTDGRTNLFGTVVNRVYAIGGKTSTDWLPSASNVDPDTNPPNTGNLNYFNYAFSSAEAAFTTAGCTEWYVYWQDGADALLGVTGSTLSNNLTTIFSTALARDSRWKAVVLGYPPPMVPGLAGGASATASANVVANWATQDALVNGTTIVAMQKAWPAFVATRLDVMPDGIHTTGAYPEWEKMLADGFVQIILKPAGTLPSGAGFHPVSGGPVR